ncbi:MAG: polyprenyl synthetase family protein [Phaeodactylibacter sp.]|nr:polyprenyl synthetase family protein [Phaeodactylibacter sp.]
MSSYTTFQQSFETFLQEHPFHFEPRSLYEPIDYIMGMGGKRLRPVLALWGCQLFRDDYEKALPVAMAIEVFHNFSLLHDDIMDEAPLRRGKPTVHSLYGINTGILSGDAMLIYAYDFLRQIEEPSAISALLEAFNRVAIEVCEGQQYDIDFENRQDVSIPEYLRMIELKTAALIGGSLEMGAIAAGAAPGAAGSLAAFGRNIGLAFQLQDDNLDTFGDPAKVGKKTGGDIARNKKTFLILKAMELAGPETRGQMEKLMTTVPEDEAGKIEAVTAILNSLNIKTFAEEAMEGFLQRAFEHLAAVPAPGDRKEGLRQLALGLMQRQA